MKVFDASAILALLNEEPGADTAARLMEEGDGIVSAANHAEVITKLVDRGMTAQDIEALWSHLPLAVEPLTQATALAAGLLRRSTRALGLSLGDRCCLALAQQQPGTTVVTADKAWKSLKSFRTTLIR